MYMINTRGKDNLPAVEFDKHNAKVKSTRVSLNMTVKSCHFWSLIIYLFYKCRQLNNYGFIAFDMVVDFIYVDVLLIFYSQNI